MWKLLPLTIVAAQAFLLLTACTSEPMQPPARATAASPNMTYGHRVATSPWGTYDEIHASIQTPEPDDGVRWRCPEEPGGIHRPWRLTLTGNQLPGNNSSDYLAHFTFTEGKYFIGYVGRSANNLPLADYRSYETVYSHDSYFRIEPYGRLTLMCRGTYTRLPASRVWSGNYWVVAHEGDISFGPAYPAGGAGYGSTGSGCGGEDFMTGANTDSVGPLASSIYDGGYDPYSPEEPSSGCGGGTGAGNTGGNTGSSGETFAATCSSLGGKLYYDFFCLEVWNESTGEYKTIWCGVAAFCET